MKQVWDWLGIIWNSRAQLISTLLAYCISHFYLWLLNIPVFVFCSDMFILHKWITHWHRKTHEKEAKQALLMFFYCKIWAALHPRFFMKSNAFAIKAEIILWGVTCCWILQLLGSLQGFSSLSCMTDLSAELQTIIGSTPCYVNLSKEVENAKQRNVNFTQHRSPYLHGITTHLVTYKK